MKKLTDDYFVSPQIRIEDLEAISAAGIKTVVNNRPDGETWFQPSSDDINAAARALGLTYHDLPVSRAIAPDMIEALQTIIENTPKPILAFCNSGTRSTFLWAFAQAGTLPTDDIINAASHAGYDLSHLRPMLMSLVE